MDFWYETTQKTLLVADTFGKVWTASGGPSGPALYGRFNGREKTWTVYFSPSAAQLCPELLESSNAVKCEPPRQTLREGQAVDLGFLAGDQNSTERIG